MTATQGARQRTRVLLVGPSLAYLGGQAIQAQRLLRRLGEDPELAPSFLPVNPQLSGIPGRLQRVKYLRTVVTSVAYLASLLRAVRTTDVVHAFSASYWSFLLAPVPAMIVGRLAGVGVLLNYRSGEADDHLGRWPGTTRLMRLADEVVAPSGYLVDVFARHGVAAAAIVNFVEVDSIRFRSRSALTPSFLSNRNFEPHYNVACVLRAFALIQREVPQASLVVAGDGPLRRDLHELAAALRLRNVEFTGAVRPERMPDLYDAADVYLNAPSIDNMPNSVIECFAAGLPVVTTDAGGIPYVVRNGENGLMVSVNDHVALARESLRLLNDTELAGRLSVDAREECLARYTWSAVGKEWRRCYQRLARRSPDAESADRGAAPADAAPYAGSAPKGPAANGVRAGADSRVASERRAVLPPRA